MISPHQITRTRANRRTLLTAACAGTVLAAGAATHAGNDGNVARYRFANATSAQGPAIGAFVTDGRIGPENSWVSLIAARPRINIFFDRPTTIGSFHVYSGGERDDPTTGFTVQYRSENNVFIDVPGAAVSGNTDAFLEVTLPSPITTDQLLFSFDGTAVTIQEIATFSPAAQPFPPGSGVNTHLARQHRLALTPASSTTPGTSRRAVVDGFVNDTDYWLPGAGTNHWIELDLTDPPETDPVSVRTETTPVEVGAVHIHSGLASGAAPVSRGRMQTFDDNTQVWTDIPGSDFNANTSPELELVFDAPVTTARLRLVIQGAAAPIREIVPLPAPPASLTGWPIGTGVIANERTDVRTYDDDFHTITLEGTGLAIASTSSGTPELRPAADFIGQHYQILLTPNTDTYRIRNRVTGLCLEPADASNLSGAPVIETTYYGLPTQRWKIQTTPAGARFVNSSTGHTLTADATTQGAGLVQLDTAAAGQLWQLDQREHAPKKGNGGFPQLSETLEISWAYNWGPDDLYPAQVDFWPMQWGSFNWTQRPSLAPIWQRNPEPIVLMGYNEPDKADQANMPVDTGIAMWPRLETFNLPLLGPALAGHPAFHPWIETFMDAVDEREMRVDYTGVHHYANPNPDGLINKINDTWQTFGREVVVSEFSVVDWQNTNSWTQDPNYNFFAEILWRMEELPHVHRYAVFIFTEEPGNDISDNRGEMRNADGTLTPEGRLYAAWDGDTQLRTDTPYHVHNQDSFSRLGSVAGQSGTASVQLGDRTTEDAPFRWQLIPTDTTDIYSIQSVDDGRVFSFGSRGPELVDASNSPTEQFRIVEIEHGWFAIENPINGFRITINNGSLALAAPGTTDDNARWRFGPVFQGPPGPPREGSATDAGAGQVDLEWAPHGFRDLIGFTVNRTGPGVGPTVQVATDVTDIAFTDQVPEPGVYTYTVTALGDTGESEPAPLGTVTIQTCTADFNGDFNADAADITEAIIAVEAGTDLNGDTAADFFDILWFLEQFDAGCDL